MREVVIKLSNFIRTGEPQQISLGPWPDWICKGDPWGYGAEMEDVRSSAAMHGLVPVGGVNHKPPKFPSAALTITQQAV